ncbi:helix-turn-helix domain-containing protein [Streptomyces sp. DSM 44917]|uniref:Helix-turn-helix domain-containing protein n=1 Tax=Streptomyces boetiae TaxID=3075541 RepID=A0ABU2L5Q5_9ACTN|nr:helix-turn-helix domain-containing protein [Streptomyces sp. DSM 44917]MDT0306895.1 helix-turn-helix domain-containing protein [Streptomyces sp. DSM 44917]
MAQAEAGFVPNPWRELPPQLAGLLRPRLDSIEAELVDEVRRAVAVYRQPPDSPVGRDVVSTTRRALAQFVELIENPDRPQAEHAAFFRRLGRLEYENGRGTDLIQAAYRTGARVASRGYATAARAGAMPGDVAFSINDAVLAHISVLSDEAVRGYTEAMDESDGDVALARRSLARRLLEPAPGVAEETLELLAARARWEWPRTVACVLLPGAPEVPSGAVTGGDAGILVARRGTALCLIVPDPERTDRAQALRQRLRGRTGVLGPAVPPEDARISLQCARLALRLVAASPRGGPLGLVDAAERLADVHLLGAAPIGELLADRALRPLRGLTPGKAARLAETLEALLSSWRRTAPEVAEALGIHPHTARYRIRQLEELFGERMSDPGFRFEAMLALRTRALGAQPPG